MNFYYFAWIAATAYASETILGKLISKHKTGNQWHFAFMRTLYIGIIVIVVSLFAGGVSKPTDYLFLGLAALASFIALTLIVMSLYRLDVSVLAPILNFRTVFTVLFGIILLSEVLTTNQYILIGIMFFAAIFLTVNDNAKLKAFISKDTLIALAMTAFLALFGVLSSRSIEINGFWTHMLWLSILMLLFNFSLIPLFIKEIKLIQKKTYLGIFVMAILGTIGTISSLKAFEHNVAISTAIVSLPLAMIVAYLVQLFRPDLLETNSNKVYFVRFIAATVMLLAALGLRLI